MVPGHNHVNGAKIPGNGRGGFVNGAQVLVDVRKVHHGVVPVGQDGDDGIHIFIFGGGVLMDIVKAKRQVAHREGDIVAKGVPLIAMNHLRLGDIHQRCAALFHSSDRLISKGLVVPGVRAVLDEVVLEVGNVLILLVVIRRLAVDQILRFAGGIRIRCGSHFRNAADMVGVGMRADNEVQMCDAELVDHVVGNILAIAAVDLAGKAVHRSGIHGAVCVLNGRRLAVTGVHQAPVAARLHQNHVAFQAVIIHVKIIDAVSPGGVSDSPADVEDKQRPQHQAEGKEQHEDFVPFQHVRLTLQTINDKLL